MNKKIIIIVLVVIACAFIAYGLSRSVPQRINNSITIGFIGALTGDAAFYGEDDRDATLLAQKEINDKGGINGRFFTIIFEDGGCDSKKAVLAAQKLINVDKVSVILGGTCSGETLAVAPITERSNVLLFSSYSTSQDITNAGEYVLRNSPSNTQIGGATAELAFGNGVRTIAVIAENTEYASGFAQSFEEKFIELGGVVVSKELYAPGTSDFRSYVTKASSTQTDAVAVFPQGESGAYVIKQLREVGYIGPLYGNPEMVTENVYKLSGGATNGLYAADAAGLSEQNAKALAFLTRFEAEYGRKPTWTYYAGARYDSVYLIAQAIVDVGEDASALKDYLLALENYNGTLGTYHFDENGDVVGIRFAFFQVKDGKAVEIIDDQVE